MFMSLSRFLNFLMKVFIVGKLKVIMAGMRMVVQGVLMIKALKYQMKGASAFFILNQAKIRLKDYTMLCSQPFKNNSPPLS